MKKAFIFVVFGIIFVMNTVVWVLFLDSKIGFLPSKFTTPIGDMLLRIFDAEEENTSIDQSNYVLLSSITESPLLEDMDLLLPKGATIPTREEISKAYRGIYSDTMVISVINNDIIIQNYGVEITEISLLDFRETLVSNLKQSRPDISFDTSRVVQKDDIEIPVIEFLTQYEGRVTYSFIALINVKGKLVTITINSAENHDDASRFFDMLISNVQVK